MTFNFDGTFTIETNDLALVGTHELRIKTSLVEYPDVLSVTETILPLEFTRCQLILQDWKIGEVSVPPETEAYQVFEEPSFAYKTSNCRYNWSNFSFLVTKADGSELTAPEEYLSLTAENRTLTYHEQLVDEEVVLKVSLIADLSDGLTQVISTFTVTF